MRLLYLFLPIIGMGLGLLNPAISHAMENPPSSLPSLITTQDKEEQLIEALKKGDLDKVKQIFTEEKIDANKILNGKGPALFYAAANGHAAIVQYLITEKRANIHLMDGELTALMLASMYGHLETVRLLLPQKSNPYDQSHKKLNRKGFSALHYAAKKGHLEIVKCFAERPDFAPATDGVIAMHLAQSKNHEEIIKYLESKDVPRLPNSETFSDLKTIFYNDEANKHFSRENFQIIAHYTKQILPQQDIPSLAQGGTLNVYVPQVSYQVYPNDEFIEQQLKHAAQKLGGTEDKHKDTSPIFGGTCAYNAVKNALVGLILLHDYDALVECCNNHDMRGVTRNSELLSSDLQNLVSLKQYFNDAKYFNAANFLEELHAKTFAIQQEQFLQKVEAIHVSQPLGNQQMHVAQNYIERALQSLIDKRHNSQHKNYNNFFSFVGERAIGDCYFAIGLPYNLLYDNTKLSDICNHKEKHELLEQIALFRTSKNYRHAFIVSLNTAEASGYGQTYGDDNRMHAISIVIDKRDSLINVFVYESNNRPPYSIKQIIYDFLGFFVGNERFSMNPQLCTALVADAQNPLGHSLDDHQQDLPSMETLIKKYAQLKNSLSISKKRDDIHYAFYLLSRIDHVCEAMEVLDTQKKIALQELLQKYSLSVDKRFLREEEITLHKITQEIENKELNNRLFYLISSPTPDLREIQEALNIGVNPNATNDSSSGLTFLCSSVLLGKYEVAEYLLTHGADVNAKSENGSTAIMHAAARRDPRMIRLLMSHGADVNSEDNNGCNALMYTASTGHQIDKRLEIVKLLLEQKADPSKANKNGQNSLQVHAICGALDVVQHLINEVKMKVDLETLLNCTTHESVALEHGCLHGPYFSPQLLEYCIKELNLKSNPKVALKALIAAVQTYHVNFVKRLLEKDCGLNINSKDENGWTAFMHAVNNEQTPEEMLDILVSSVNLNERNNAGQSVFDLIIQKGDTRRIHYFLQKNCGFTIEYKDQNGLTAVLYAAARCDRLTLRTLVEQLKAKINATDNSGRTALMLTAGKHIDGITCKATECKTKPQKNSSWKLKEGHLEMVQYLVSNGCNPKATDKNGRIALDYAKEAGRDKVAEYLASLK